MQGITRPEGTPIGHTSIPFLLSMQNASQLQTMTFMKDRMEDMLKQADEIATNQRNGPDVRLMQQLANTTHRMVGEMHDLQATTHRLVGETHDMVAITNELRDHIADFDDFFRPVRNYFYWEPHCYDIPICWALRSIFDAMDGVDQISDKLP